MSRRIEVAIPAAVVADYQDGRVTLAELALHLGVSQHTVRRKLRSLGVDTAPRTRKRLKFAHHVEDAEHLAPGTAYTTVVELYRQGYSTQKIGRRLHMNPRTVTLILIRMGIPLRSVFYRSVFEGRMEHLVAFAERLQSLRLALGFTKKGLAELCGLNPATIRHLETCRNGPHWETLYKLCDGLEVRPEAMGIDWEPAWVEEEDVDAGGGDVDVQAEATTISFDSSAFDYTSARRLTALDLTCGPVCNMVYDTVAWRA